MTGPAPPIADTLRVILPPSDDLLLIRVLAGPDETVAESWASWRQSAVNVRQLFGEQQPELRRLLPLLAYRLRRAGISVDAELQHLLQAAQLWEDLRVRRILEILATTLDKLSAIGVAPVVVGGLATALVAYPRLQLRHCHDIDLLVPIGSVGRARQALVDVGFHAEAESPDRPGTLTLHHHDGLPINLHTALIASQFYRLRDTDMLERAGNRDVANHTVRVLSPMDALLHQMARTVTTRKPKLISSLTDAALIAATETDDGEWDRFAANTISARLSLQAFAILSCLDRTIGCRVPARVLRRVAEDAQHLGAESVDMALHHARSGQDRSLASMIAVSGWRSRLTILRWLVCPSPGFLRDWCNRRGVSWTPLWYVGRPFRRAAIRVWRVGGTAPKPSPPNVNVPGA